jgi:hypothetical protein
MNYQRQMMRARVCKQFARVPGQHGDMAVPLFYPVPISSGSWGPPFCKIRDGIHSQALVGFLGITPAFMYFNWKTRGQFTIRCWWPGRVANRLARMSAFYDIDDPDHWIKWEKLCEEEKAMKHYVGYGGTNYLASYLWTPGDPEPDLRRREAPEGAH